MEKKIENLIWAMVGLVAVVAAVVIILSVLFGGGYTGGSYPYGMMGYGIYGMGIVMPIIGIISVVFVLIFIYFILEAARGPQPGYQDRYSSRSEDIARERFARGEISETEYNRILENLRK